MTLFLLFFSSLTFAHIIQDDVKTVQKHRFSLKAVCDRMVLHESPMIDILSGTELDCMGKKVDVNLFCDKELSRDPYYIRAFIDNQSKEVICHTGKTVIFKYLCTRTKDFLYCDREAKSGCGIIKSLLAKRLEMVHSSFTKNDKGIKQLNCYFEALNFQDKSVGTI